MIFCELIYVMRNAAKIALLGLALAAISGIVVGRSAQFLEGTDFPDFYSAAKMVQEGAGAQLYSIPAQQKFQARYTGRAGSYFIHPAFETLLYLPFCLFSLPRAYALWNLFNLALLVVAARVLQREVLPTVEWAALPAIFLVFVPLLLNFQQGQDSVLLLFLLTLGFAALKKEKDFAAGCFLAGGLFKFHLILPIVFALLPGRFRKLFAGFSLVAALLALLSMAISGRGFFLVYPRFLAQLESLPIAGVHPEAMANIRGLVSLVFHRGEWNLALVVAGSLSLLALAVTGWLLAGSTWHAPRNLAFANAVSAGALCGYHLSPHDLSILLLPLALIFQHLRSHHERTKASACLGLDLAVFFLPPLHIFLLVRQRYAYAAVPILVLFILTFLEIRRSPRTANARLSGR